jgi:hypothetical protein
MSTVFPDAGRGHKGRPATRFANSTPDGVIPKAGAFNSQPTDLMT